MGVGYLFCVEVFGFVGGKGRVMKGLLCYVMVDELVGWWILEEV